MNKFVSVPNLPENCSAVIYGEKYAKLIQDSLDSLNIRSIFLPNNPDVDPRLSGHVDLSVLHVGGERFFLVPYLKRSRFAETLKSSGAQVIFPDISQGIEYPQDAPLNLCLTDQYAICNPKTAEKSTVDYLTIRGDTQFIPCKQGYSRCAVCLVDARSIITADRGIASAAEYAGLSVLWIQPGFVQLEGYAYGFIGGASFKISADKLAFTGKLDGHPDRELILRFLKERLIEPIYLTEEPVFDIGSAIPIYEN